MKANYGQVDPGFVYKIVAINPASFSSTETVGFLFEDEASSTWLMHTMWEAIENENVPSWAKKAGRSGSTTRSPIIRLEPYSWSNHPNNRPFPDSSGSLERALQFMNQYSEILGEVGATYFHAKID